MVYYLGYYNCEQIAAEKRVAAPPAMNKMGYIISALSEAYDDLVAVISASETRLPKLVKGSLCRLDRNVSLRTFDSIYSKNKIVRGLGHLLTRSQLEKFLLKKVKREDTLVVYHSLWLMNTVKKVKSRTNCRLIIEVEELYSDVKEDEALRKKEIDYLQIAEKYIVITELLNKQINLQNKPKIISHGTYKTIPKYTDKFNDGKIHIVYAGSFNPIKGGACTAIEVAEFLTEKYVLHVLGKGTVSETETVMKKIDQVSSRSKCQIIFDGYKIGKDFDSFIQSCHIGLSTQQPDGKYNASSFPSKILMYMSNDLPVVSVKIPAVESSAIGKYIYYYDITAPDQIAEAIISVPSDSNLNVREKLNELNVKFISDLADLLT